MLMRDDGGLFMNLKTLLKTDILAQESDEITQD